MKRKPPYIKFYIKDVAFDTQGMTNSEIGKYIKALIESYKTLEIPEKYQENSLFLELKNSISSYASVCETNRANRLKSNTSNNGSSTNGQRMVNDTVNQEPEPITNNHKKSNKTKKGFRIPDDWDCSEELGNWAMGQGLSREEVINEIDGFVDHWKASTGKGSVALDWDRKFKTWIRNAIKWRNK